jgi:hypothetical protein
MKRGRPGVASVRRSKNVGPDYPEDRFVNPVDAGMSSQYGDKNTKTVFSDNSTTFEGGGAPLNKDGYDALWGGK